MFKKVLSLFLAGFMLFSMIPVSATESSAAAAGSAGGAASGGGVGTGPFLRGTVQVPSGYCFSGEEMLDIYISESYEPSGYEHYVTATVNSNGTYEASIPSSLIGSYAVSAYTRNFSAPAVAGTYNCDNNAMISFDGNDVSGVNFTVEKGKTISGQLTLGSDAILENGTLFGWVCAYEYTGQLLDMEDLGEGQYNTFFEGETGAVSFELTIPESVENVVLAAMVCAEATGTGTFRSNILSEYVYYTGETSSLTYTDARIITANGDVSNIGIELPAGVGISLFGKLPDGISSYKSAKLYFVDKESGSTLEESHFYFDSVGTYETIVFPREYRNKEIYIYYDLNYSDDTLYTDPLYINPDGSLAKTKEDAVAHTLTGANAVSFTAGLKTDYTSGITGTISFEDGCVLNGYFNCTITAKNTVTNQYEYTYVNKTGIGEYSYVLPISEDGTYIVWANIYCYDEDSNVSECDHYYASTGMVYQEYNAEVIDTTLKNTGIDFEFKKTKTFHGKLVPDGDFVSTAQFKPELQIQSENGSYWEAITLKDDLTFEVQIPVNIQGDCTAYIYANAGSTIIPDYYYYINDATNGTFDVDAGDIIEFPLKTGNMIRGKMKLPEGVSTTDSKQFELCLATVNTAGYINVNQRCYLTIKGGETEQEFIFAVPKDSQTNYILYGQLQGTVSGIYSGNFYYAGNETSSVNQQNAIEVTGGTENIVFPALTGNNSSVTIVNPAGGEYLDGSYTIDFGDFKERRYFYLSSGKTKTDSIVLTQEHIGLTAYVYYTINRHSNTPIYVNPDGSLTNNKSEATPHTITASTSFNITLSLDENLYAIPSIKGTLALSDDAYITYSNGDNATLEGNLYLHKDGSQMSYHYIEITAGNLEEFQFELDEIGDYILSVRLSNWSYDTNVICNQTMYYTGDGWSADIEDAKLINNATAQNLALTLPDREVMKGTVDFPEETFLNEEIRYEITYSSLDGSATKSKTGYISEAEDFEYKTTGIDDVDEYYVSIRFGSYYSQYDTNIPYGKTYYYTENGLTTDESAEKKVVKSTDTIVFNMPVMPTIRGTVTFPEGTVLSGEGYLFIELEDENGNRINYRQVYTDTAQNIEYALAGDEEIQKYCLSVTFNAPGYETELEEGCLYYTNEGMTSNVNAKKYYTIEELSNVVLPLRNKRYITGKLASEDFVNYDQTLSGRSEFFTGTMWTYPPVEFDEELNYRIQIPSNVDGPFTFGITFDDQEKNNILKGSCYYYCDENGDPKQITYPNYENIDIRPELGYVFSGVVKLPENAVVYENQDISGTVYYGSNYQSNFLIPYGETEGEFFMVVTKEAHSGLLYTSNGTGMEGKAKNLYLGQVYYKDDTTSVATPASASKYKVSQQIMDAKLMLLTGEVYNIELVKPATVTTSERISVYGKIGTESVADATVTIASDETTKTASLVIPEDYNGQDMYIHYNLYYDNANTLYKENVYINPDKSLSGAKKLAEPFEIGTGGVSLSITLADDTGINFPEYKYVSPYPYKDNASNEFQYEYTDGECDFLKVTFSEETAFAYESYSRRDCLYINYGDNESLGPYYGNSLAGKTINIPGNSFKAYIEQKASSSAFGFAIESIEPKVYTLESTHPYNSSTETTYPYTHSTDAEGLRLHFSKDTSYSGSAKITYTDKNGATRTNSYYSSYLAGSTIDVRGKEFTITLPSDTSGNYYGFSIVEIEEIEYCDVVFQNYDGTVLYETEVEKGTSTYYRGSTPARERDENYIYRFDGWDKSLETITEDLVVTALYSENPYATVEFKTNAEDTEPLYTDYVVLGENASFHGDVYPSKASTATAGYVFAGWSRSLKNIQEDVVLTAEFEEYDILMQSQHPFGDEEQTYTYEGSADSILLVFSSDSYIGEDEYLYIYDEAGNEVFYISGESLANEEYIIVGKTATLRLEGANENFGYALLQVIPMWHDFSVWMSYVNPSCTGEGQEYRWCRHCYTEEDRTIPALGHSYAGWEEDLDGTIFRECTRCTEREIMEGNLTNCGLVNINVVDAVTMEPLDNVTITSYDESGNEAVWYTNDQGIASQILPKGINNLVVYADGYMVRNIALDVVGGVTDVPVIGLTEKPAVECKLEAKIMDMEEIKAAGIDITDPLNSHVYKYRINLGFGEAKTVYFNKEGNYIDTGGNLVVRNRHDGTSASIHPINERYYLVIYGQSKWLKEMFDVELIAVNTSNTDTVENLVAELSIPTGMSLAAMNRAPQSDVQKIGSLASGESKSVHWYLRGDQAGEYTLSAKLTGTLMPFGEQFGYEYTTDEPVKVYAGNALQMNLVVPAVATYGEDYTVKIEIKNVSDRSVYNLSNSIDKVLQSKLLLVDQEGYEKYFEENALGYVAVDELKPGEKIVAEIQSNILFQSNIIKEKIDSLANQLQNQTDILAIFNSYKSTLDLFNDNYDIIHYALDNVTKSSVHLTEDQKAVVAPLEEVLTKCELLIREGVSSRAMYFINRLKQENTMEELIKLSKDSNYYTVWENEELSKLANELDALYTEATLPETCSDYDIYEDVKRVIEAIPVNFWLRGVFVSTLEGSTTDIPYTVTLIPSDKSYTGVTNISNYYYNILTNAIDRLAQPWYTEVMGEIRDPEGVAQANEIIKTDIGETLTFAVTDVSGDTRFRAWVEGESGKPFEVSSTAEDATVTESGITFTGPSYLSVSALTQGTGTLHVEKVSDIATFSAEETVYTFKLEAGEAHTCASEQWVELVAAYDDQDGYHAKYCDICNQLIDIKTVVASDECSTGSYQVSEETITNGTFTCKMTFDGETPARSAVAILVMKNADDVTVHIGTDDIKIKPNATVDLAFDVQDVAYADYEILLWDSFTKLRPVANN